MYIIFIYQMKLPFVYKTKPSIHFVNGLNVEKQLIKPKHLYVFRDPLLKNNKFISLNQGVFASISRHTLNEIKSEIDLYFDIQNILYDDFETYLEERKQNAVVIYNAYSDLKQFKTYFLYFEMSPSKKI